MPKIIGIGERTHQPFWTTITLDPDPDMAWCAFEHRNALWSEEDELGDAYTTGFEAEDLGNDVRVKARRLAGHPQRLQTLVQRRRLLLDEA